MKRLSLLLISVALLFGMTQCKKKVETITPATVGETVHISLNVEGSKHSVFPSIGAVVYTDGDTIYVGNKGKYVGKLVYANGAFSGDLTGVSTSDYLHFFFIGGLTPSTNPTTGTTTSFGIDISDQRNKLPVLSYGKSNIKYTSGTTTYSSILENQCALVRFTLDNPVPNPIWLTGLRTTAVIDFANNAVTPNSSTGTITTNIYEDGACGYRYAIVFATQAIAIDKSGGIICGGGVEYDMPTAATANAYITDGTISITGGFTINSSGDKVIFSQGNLQYQASTNTWRFAENQYDYIGNAAGNTTAEASRSIQSAWIDLFGWGTSGYDHGAVCYQPWSVSTSNYDYYAYGSNANNLNDGDGTADWGYNAISNGGNQAGLWRTLTSAEWRYLMETRANATSKIGYATVGGKVGIIILPDSFTDPMTNTDSGLFVPKTTTGWTANVYTAGANWDAMEAAGALFLPVAGIRNGETVSGLGSSAEYWSTTQSQGLWAYRVYFTATDVQPATYTRSRYMGTAVRLVVDL